MLPEPQPLQLPLASGAHALADDVAHDGNGDGVSGLPVRHEVFAPLARLGIQAAPRRPLADFAPEEATSFREMLLPAVAPSLRGERLEPMSALIGFGPCSLVGLFPE